MYSKRIAGRVQIDFRSWLDTAGPVDCFALIEYLTVILEYAELIQFLLVGYSQLLVGSGRYQTYHWLHFMKRGIQLIIILEVYSCDHACQLEYSKNT